MLASSPRRSSEIPVPVPLALALLLLGACDAATQAVWLTSIQPFTGADWDAGISMRIGAQIMLEEVNAHPGLLPGYEIRVAWQDGRCSKTRGTRLFLRNLFHQTYPVFAPGRGVAELDADGDGTVTTADTEPMGEVWNSSQVHPRPVGLLGSGCAGTALNIANIAYMARFPMVSNSATRPGLSDRGAYPNFFRTIMPDTFFNAAWLTMARELNQSSVGVVIGEIENWGSMGTTLAREAAARGMQLVGNDLTPDMAGFYGMKVALDSQAMAAAAAADLVRYKPRVVILLMFHRRNRLVLCEAHRVAFFNAVYMPMGWLPFGWWSIHDTGCLPAQLTGMATSFISANMMFWRADGDARLSCSANMTARQFQDEWFRRQGGAQGDLSMRPEGYAPATEAATTGDALCMYAQMLHEVLITRGVPLADLTERTVNGYSNVIDVLSNIDFEGVQGRVRFEPGKADPLGSVILQQLQRDRGGSLTLLDVASYKHPDISYLGLGALHFQFPGEHFLAGPRGAATIGAHLTSFRVCVNQVLNMRTNLCENCPNNTQYVQRSGACLCTAGFYSTSSGCAPCAPGTISTAPGALRCAACGVGRYALGGAASCTFCPRGRYADVPGLGACRGCPALRTTAEIAAKSPADCLCSRAAYREADGSCAACPPNASAPGLGSPSLASCLCPAGEYREGAECRACPAGSATAGGGQTSLGACRCERDSYMSGGACRACPVGSSTTAGGKTGVRSCLCGAGTYMPLHARECLRCPEGMLCPRGSSEAVAAAAAGGAGEERVSLRLRPRYWAAAGAPMSVFECSSEERCPGDRLPGDACAEHLEHRACGRCAAGRRWTGAECEACAAFEPATLLLPLLPSVALPCLICGMYRAFGDTPNKWGTKRNGAVALAFVLLDFYQTVEILRSTNIRLPSVSGQALSLGGLTGGAVAVLRLECVGYADFRAAIVLRGLAPLLLGGYCILSFCAAWLLARRLPGLLMEMNRLLNVFGSLMFTFFNTIAALCLLLFRCSRNPNGTLSLRIDMSVICFSSDEWRSMVPAAGIFVLLYVVGMGGVFARVVVIAPRRFADPGFRMRWKFLFIKFRSNVHWWSLVFLLKSFLTNLGFVVTSSGIAQLYLGMSATTLYMLALILLTPYRHRVANGLDVFSSLSLVYISALLTWHADRSAHPLGSSVSVSVVLVSAVPACTAAGCLAYLVATGARVPASARGRARGERQFQDVVACYGELSRLDREEGATALLEVGEWDRRYLRNAAHAIRVEALGEDSAHRIADLALSQRVAAAIRATKRVRGTAAARESRKQGL